MAASTPGVPEVGTDGHHLDCGCADPRKLGPWISASRIETGGKDKFKTEKFEGKEEKKIDNQPVLTYPCYVISQGLHHCLADRFCFL